MGEDSECLVSAQDGSHPRRPGLDRQERSPGYANSGPTGEASYRAYGHATYGGRTSHREPVWQVQGLRSRVSGGGHQRPGMGSRAGPGIPGGRSSMLRYRQASALGAGGDRERGLRRLRGGVSGGTSVRRQSGRRARVCCVRGSTPPVRKGPPSWVGPGPKVQAGFRRSVAPDRTHTGNLRTPRNRVGPMGTATPILPHGDAGRRGRVRTGSRRPVPLPALCTCAIIPAIIQR